MIFDVNVFVPSSAELTIAGEIAPVVVETGVAPETTSVVPPVSVVVTVYECV